jgi:predicted SprT family Zn-dependent metalloprotease
MVVGYQNSFWNKFGMKPTLDDIEHYALSQIKKHLKHNWAFRWSDKMTSAFGYCYPNKIIQLSSKFTLLNINFFHIVKDTILHEIAHAIQLERQGILGHNKDWKKICMDIGAKPLTTFSRYDVTCPDELYALRNSVTGKVYEYHKEHIQNSLEEYTTNFIEEPLLPNRFEYVWCGK